MNFVIFDIDGTLANTKKVEDRCFMKAFEETFAIDIWNQEWGHFKNVTDWGITEEIIQKEKGRKPSREEYKLMKSSFVQNLKHELERDKTQFAEVKGATDLFNELKKDENIALGIATGGWEASALLKLNAIEIDISDICFSNSDHFKSREDITLDVIQQLERKTNQKPQQIIYFGDGKWDYYTCLNLGIHFIGVDIEGDGKLSELGAKSIFRDFSNFDSKIDLIS